MKAWPGISRTVLLGLLVVLAQVSDAVTAELKIMTLRSMWTVLNEIGPQFERTSRYKLNVITGIAATLANRIIAGESFDIFIGPPVQMDRVIQNNKIIAGTRTAIAHSGIGVEVRAGAPKPDIQFCRSLQARASECKVDWLPETRRDERSIFGWIIRSPRNCGGDQVQSRTP